MTIEAAIKKAMIAETTRKYIAPYETRINIQK